VEFRLLGPLEVVADGRSLDLGAHKQRALLGLLLLSANSAVPSDRLIDALWDDDPPETARKALQVYVAGLRKQLGRDRLETRPPGYLLKVEPEELDAARFARLQEEGRLDEALSLWRGPPLADLASEQFVQAEIARLDEMRVVCLEERAERELAAGRHTELVGDLEVLVSEHPFRERLRGQLMLALYRSGRQADALEAYSNARTALVEELGIEPGRRLRELHQRILEQDERLDPRTQAATPGNFVGREPELAALMGALDRAAAGQGGLFLIGGEPGIGKSRLAEEVANEARARGMRVLVGRCWEAGGAPAYWPWVQALREISPELERPTASESEGARFRLFESVARLVREAAEIRPIVLVLDDLHAADAGSLLLLQFLARELRDMRTLVLASYRDVDPVPDPRLTEMLADVGRESLTRRLHLGGLSRDELADYVDVTAAEIGSPEMVARLHEDTEGNPLLAGEIVRLFAEEGSTAIPQSIHDVIARRLGHLSDECNRVLALASVMGREFAVDVLAQMAGLPDDDLLDLLDEPTQARVLSDVPGGRGILRFAHVLIRDTLYEGLTPTRRMRVHRLAVQSLEARYEREPGPHLAELAHHSMAGSDFGRGLEYARRAAERAMGQLAYEESARLYNSALAALELASPDDEGARCELLLALGDSHARAGDTPAASEAFYAAAEIAKRLRMPRALAVAAAGVGGRMDWSRAGDDAERVPLLEDALQMLGDADPELRAKVLGRLAGALRDELSLDRRGALSREAVELARASGSRAALASALSGRAAAICAPDTVAECLAIGSELGEIAAEIGDSERVVGAHMYRVIGLLQLGEVDQARVELRAARVVAEELRQPAQLWEVQSGEALLSLAAGRFDEAERLIEECFAVGEHVLGGLAESLPGVAELAAEYTARPLFRCALTHLEARLGSKGARQSLVELIGDALPFDQEWLLGISLLSETAVLVGDVDAAARLYDRLEPWSGCAVSDPGEAFRGAVDRDLGNLASLLSRFDEADQHFQAATAMNTRMGARPWLARTREDHARMLLARGRPGDQEHAQDLLRAARSSYRDLGMTAR
jgi:DNA-binding SARP family transcriptional activator/tetratricopeptide (TPR) repeat protein